jgi:hypothetical protein
MISNHLIKKIINIIIIFIFSKYEMKILIILIIEIIMGIIKNN